jgi:hypothetical protein
MRLTPDIAEYDCEQIGTVLAVLVGHDAERDEQEFWSPVEIVSYLQVSQLRGMNDKPGRPRFFCQLPQADRSIIVPKPDKPYRLRVRFYPPGPGAVEALLLRSAVAAPACDDPF